MSNVFTCICFCNDLKYFLSMSMMEELGLPERLYTLEAISTLHNLHLWHVSRNGFKKFCYCILYVVFSTMSLNINWSTKLCMPPIFVCFNGYTLFSLFICTLTNINKYEIEYIIFLSCPLSFILISR